MRFAESVTMVTDLKFNLALFLEQKPRSFISGLKNWIFMKPALWNRALNEGSKIKRLQKKLNSTRLHVIKQLQLGRDS